MPAILMVRHGTTAWNETGRLQGRADVALSPRGRAEAAGWRVPTDWAGASWTTSPLRRARATGALMTSDVAMVEPRLVEMDWGEWEGRRLDEVRAEAPAAMAANEAAGLDFRPPGGESPRDVCTRVRAWLDDVAIAPRPIVAICHKGIVRATLVLATGWDMRSKPPVRLRRGDGCAFHLDPGGRLSLTGRVPLNGAA